MSARGSANRKTVALVILSAAVLSAGVVTIRLATSHWDASAFVRAGNVYSHPGHTPKNLKVIDGIGYDGQFYYRLALDPFSGARTKFGLTLDQPGRRQQRILYPVLAWIASGGGKSVAVPWALIGINAVGLVLIAMVGTALVGTGWGFAFALVPGALVALTHDTGEVVAILLALCFLSLFRRDHIVMASIALTTAAFARETTLVFALGLLVAALMTRRRTYLMCTLVPLASFAAWQIFLGTRWGMPPLLSAGGRDIGPVPFYGLVRAAAHWFDRGARVVTWNMIFVTTSLGFLVMALRALKRRAALLHERAAFILTLVLVPFLRSDVWFNFTSFLRALSEAMVLGLMMVLSEKDKRPAIVTPAMRASP